MKNIILEKLKYWSEVEPNTRFFDDKLSSTYLELEEQSNSLAYYLEKQFAGKKNILVYGGQDSRMVVSFLAATKSGHCYIPVDKHTPKNRIEMIFEESECVCVIALCDWPLEVGYVINEALFTEILNEKKKPSFKNVVEGNDNYYTIFTSGTTGKPKGVQISYNNLVSYCHWMLSDFQLETKQRFLCQAPFSFDLSVMDVYPSLLTCGTLVPLTKDEVDNFPILFAKLPTMNLNVWVSTPSLVEICLLSPDFCTEKLPTLENFQFCGEELPHVVAAKLLERFPHAKIFNTYGPTEATVAVTAIKITNKILDTNERLPLGKVKEDTAIVIMSDDKELKENEVGEIVIVGPSVSKGYFNQESKTKEVFFTYKGKPAYRTGDAGVMINNLLYYKGRLDFQVKWHGYRMELGDIDHHLTSLDLIRNACVVPKYNKKNKVQQLIAYVVLEEAPTEETKVITEKLKNSLLETVMDYMVPQRFVYVETLPLTSNGKVDRKQLIKEVNP